MQIQSGICIELHHDHSIFLMENGQFVKGTPAGNPSIGEEASFYPFVKKRTVRWHPVLAPVAAAMAAALFMSFLVLPDEEAFGYVQVQINPGIELGINDQYEVVSIRELNSDGHDLIHQLDDWENDPLFDVLDRVFELAVTEQTEQITITAVEEDSRELDESIKKFVLAVSSIKKSESMAIHMKEATKEQWRQSKEDRVPVGQMIEKAENLKVQKESKIQEPAREVETPSAPKENKAVDEQEAPNENKETKPSKEENNSKKTNMEKEQNKNKAAEKNKTNPPAVEKKKDQPSPKTEQQQKTLKQNNKGSEPSTRVDDPSAGKKQEKEKPVKPAPKEKQVEKKEKGNSGNEKRENSEAPGQEKKSGAPAASSSSSVKKETDTPPLQDKKKERPADHTDQEKQKKGKEVESSPEKGSNQEKKAKE